mmetsp:Transcript_161/g.495  ORF Transcript_161/g.495 Transcript_161/m.495 type:complete len:408 (+) Transcript_161:71-1294(+)
MCSPTSPRACSATSSLSRGFRGARLGPGRVHLLRRSCAGICAAAAAAPWLALGPLRADGRRAAWRPACIPGPGATLLVASKADRAGTTMAKALLSDSRFEWLERSPGKWHAGALASVHLWHCAEELTRLDGIEDDWAREVGMVPGAPPLRDVVFLSRHVAASGKPSLTVHPIGNPRSDLDPFGGVAGKLSPPSPRLASLLCALAAAHGSPAFGELAEFDVTFEATHHGPLVGVPALFAEIGSTAGEWARADAGRCWAEALWAELAAAPRAPERALLVLGGGHYMPQASEAALHHGLCVGHMLPSYVFAGAEAQVARDMVREAVRATCRAHPSASELLVLVFKKKLKSAERKVVLEALEGCASSVGPQLRIMSSTTELGEVMAQHGLRAGHPPCSVTETEVARAGSAA